MRNLIKKILKEDFDWVKSVPEVEPGHLFTHDDIVFEDDEDYRVNILDGQITFNLLDGDVNEFSSGYDDDWYVKSLVTNYTPDYYDNYMDEDEINYISSYLTQEHEDRVKTILVRLGLNTEQANEYYTEVSDNKFRELGDYFGESIRNASDYWSEMESEVCSHIGYEVDKNRWRDLHEYFKSELDEYNITIHNHSYDKVIITAPYPYEINFSTSEKLTNPSRIMEYIDENIFQIGYGDVFYDSYDSEGAADDIRQSFSEMLTSVEESLDEMYDEGFNPKQTKLEL